jgi:hypothetical protein
MSNTLVITDATATVETDTPYDLDVKNVLVEFDEAWNPYCTVTIWATLPADSVVAQINPRDDIRVTLTTSQQVGAGDPQTATFDLYLIDRERDRKADTLRLEATSDDFRLSIRDLVDIEPDESARPHEGSLRAIVNSRLSGVGGELLGADILATNLAPNPDLELDLTGWSVAVNGTGNTFTVTRENSPGHDGDYYFKAACSGANSGVAALRCGGVFNVTAGQQFTFSVWARAVGGTPAVRLAYRQFTGADGGGTQSGAVDGGANVALTGSWQRLTWTSDPIPGGVGSIIGSVRISAGELGAGIAIELDGLTVVEGTTAYDFNPGNYPAGFWSQWTGTPHASTSTLHDEAAQFDWDLTRGLDVTNVVRNPRVLSNTTDWATTVGGGTATPSRVTSGGPATDCPTFYRVTATTALTGAILVKIGSNSTDGILIEEADGITASVWVRCSQAVTAKIQITDITLGSVIHFGASVAIAANTWTRISTSIPRHTEMIPGQTLVYPQAGDQVSLSVSIPTGGLPIAATFDVSGARVSRTTDQDDDSYFDGATAASTYYNHYWWPYDAGWEIVPPAAAKSRRVAKAPYSTRGETALDQQPGQSDWDFLQALVGVPGYRLFCDEHAVWRLVDMAVWPADPAHFDIETTTAKNFTDRIYLDGADSADEAVVAYEEPTTVTWDSSATGLRAKTLRGRIQRPYAGAGVASSIASRAAGRYLEAPYEGLADLDIRPSAEIAFQAETVDIFTGAALKVTWDQSTGLSTVTPRDLEEA